MHLELFQSIITEIDNPRTGQFPAPGAHYWTDEAVNDYVRMLLDVGFIRLRGPGAIPISELPRYQRDQGSLDYIKEFELTYNGREFMELVNNPAVTWWVRETFKDEQHFPGTLLIYYEALRTVANRLVQERLNAIPLR